MRYQDHVGTWREYKSSFDENDLTQLKAFLESADETVTLHEVAKGNRSVNSVAIRHDVDYDLEHALKFARWEHDLGFRATYYVLHTTWYYTYNKSHFYSLIDELISLDHEVGLHLNAMETEVVPPAAFSLLKRTLSTLRSVGYNIKGAASHGSGDINDLHLFTDFGYKPSDLGLDYEAYLLMRELPGVNYISDNHGRWRAPLEFNGKQTIMSMHPCHWPF